MSTSHGPVTAQPVARLINELARLPGIGPKTASRLAYHLLRASREEAVSLAEAILDVKERVRLCSICFNTTESDPCSICLDPGRDDASVSSRNRWTSLRSSAPANFGADTMSSMAPSRQSTGLDPTNCASVSSSRASKSTKPDEVIVATNLDLPGEATATYLHRLLAPLGVTVSRPASGLPAGGDLEYADEITLGRALTGRRVL